jgi:hypothetical protein
MIAVNENTNTRPKVAVDCIALLFQISAVTSAIPTRAFRRLILSTTRQILGQYVTLFNGRLFPHPSKFIIHYE